MEITLNNASELATVFTAVAVFISAVAAAALFYQTKRGVAQREALTIIRDQIGDKDWIKDESSWRQLEHELSLDGEKKKIAGFDIAQAIKSYATRSDNTRVGKDFIPRRSLIVRRLNRYEMIAIGIRTGSIDEETIRRWWGGPLVAEFIKHRFFIAEARQHRAKVFCEYHWLADKFADEESRRTITMVLGSPHERHEDVWKIVLFFERVIVHWRALLAIAILTAVFFAGGYLV